MAQPNTPLTLGSLFDGSGGFPLAGILAGVTPVWASEIEPFAVRVTTARIPQMKHYGDVSKIHGGDLPPVDIITFGSPCQDMSIAGKRSGLDGSRSSLFYEAIRIVKEMREKTNGEKPRWLCWENVPGAFSSNKGADFKAVLEAVIGIVEPGVQVPMPEKNRWPSADIYMGSRFSVAYRTLDAQYWGLPQRRKRIFLIGDLTGQCAGKVLFESESLSRYSSTGFRSWQRATRSVESCPGTSGFSIDGYNGTVSDTASTLGVNCGMSTGRNGVVLNDQGGNRMDVTHEVTCTLRAEAHHPPVVMDDPPAVFENHSQDTRFTGPVEVAPTVSHQYGTGGNNQPFVVKPYGISGFNSEGMLSPNPHSGIYEAEVARTVDTSGGNPACNQGGIAIVSGPPIYSLTTGSYTQVSQDTAPTLLSRDYKDATLVSEPCYGLDYASYNQGKNAQFRPCIDEELAPTQVAKGPGAVLSGYTVRRLTPTECARLQGFPDWWCSDLDTAEPSAEELAFWTEVWETHRRITSPSTKPKTEKQIRKWLADPHSDAAEYKMWGNGVALPCVFFVLAGIVYCTQ